MLRFHQGGIGVCTLTHRHKLTLHYAHKREGNESQKKRLCTSCRYVTWQMQQQQQSASPFHSGVMFCMKLISCVAAQHGTRSTRSLRESFWCVQHNRHDDTVTSTRQDVHAYSRHFSQTSLHFFLLHLPTKLWSRLLLSESVGVWRGVQYKCGNSSSGGSDSWIGYYSFLSHSRQALKCVNVVWSPYLDLTRRVGSSSFCFD